MTIRDEVLAADVAHVTAGQAEAAVLGMLVNAAVLGRLLASKAGGSLEPSHEANLTPAEFDAVATSASVRQRISELADEGVGVQHFDVVSTGSGRRGKSLRIWLLG